MLAGPRAEPALIDTGLQIGIWAPEVGDDGTVEFVRSRAHAHEGRYWADVERIPSKQEPRVVLLGESVARGYLFDPSVTPAAVLSTLLGGGVEVVLSSRFALVRSHAGFVRLDMTCRAPSGGEVGVRVNGEIAGTAPLGSAWQTSTLTVPAREGLNWIELQWPPAAPPLDELEQAARRLERGLYPDVFPAYGEIHAFTASSC